MSDTYRTIRAPFTHEIERIKGSRFIATLAPLADPADVEPLLAALRREHKNARHHGWAWRLEREPRTDFRSSDDGEPGGSAGRPILAQLEGHGVTNLIAVVTRYFGGTKLGVGGLVRAYAGAVAAALDRADVVTVVRTRACRLTFPYAFSHVVEGLLAQYDLRPRDATYGERVTLLLDLPRPRLQAFADDVRERTNGELGVQPV